MDDIVTDDPDRFDRVGHTAGMRTVIGRHVTDVDVG